MNVSLTPELEQLVQQKVKSGRYLSASEVVREALRLLEERDRIRETRINALRSEIAVGMEQGEQSAAACENMGSWDKHRAWILEGDSDAESEERNA